MLAILNCWSCIQWEAAEEECGNWISGCEPSSTDPSPQSHTYGNRFLYCNIYQIASVTFPKYVWATKCYAYRWDTTFQKSNMAAEKLEVCKPFVVICGSNHISSSGHIVTKLQLLHPYFWGPSQWCCQKCHGKSCYTGNTYDGHPKPELTLSQHIGLVACHITRHPQHHW